MSGAKRREAAVNGSRKRARIVDDEDASGSSSDVEIDVSDDSEESGDEDDEEEEEADDDEEDEDEDDDDDEVDKTTTGLSAGEKIHSEQRILAESRDLGNSIKQSRAKAAREGGLDVAKKHLNRVNDSFTEQQRLHLDNKTLEMYDSKNLFDSSDLIDIATRNIKFGNTRRGLKPDEFVKRMKEMLLKQARSSDADAMENPEEYNDKKHPFGTFNWFLFGTFAYTRGRKATTTDHLLGPLEIEKKIRQFKPREKLKTTSVVTTAEAVTSEDVDRNAKDNTATAVQNCYKEFCEKSTGGPMNMFKFFINPYSFSQTVENMFYTSFLLRDGRLLMDEDEDGYPTISHPPPLPNDPLDKQREQARRQQLHSNHIIFHLEYDSWKKLIKLFNITEPYLEHRHETPA